MTIKPIQLILPEYFDLSGIGLSQRKSFYVGRDCKSIELDASGAATVTIEGKGVLYVLPSGAVAIVEAKPEAKAEPKK
jgi:hypothetical protein